MSVEYCTVTEWTFEAKPLFFLWNDSRNMVVGALRASMAVTLFYLISLEIIAVILLLCNLLMSEYKRLSPTPK